MKKSVKKISLKKYKKSVKKISHKKYKKSVKKIYGPILSLKTYIGGFDKKTAKSNRKFSKSYCLKKSCNKMGFSEKASCRYYKNCYK